MEAIVIIFPRLVSAATSIQSMGGTWYQASTDFEEFQLKLGRLYRLNELWLSESRKPGGLQDDLALKDTLHDAALLLERTASLLMSEERKLKSREEAKGTLGTCLTSCWPMFWTLMFPTEVKARITLVVDTFESIPGFLKSQEDAKRFLEERILSRTYSSAFEFRSDDRYVSLTDSEDIVHSALRNPKPILVLLHGGPGQGKSTLARHVALHYKDQRKMARGGTDGALFDQVVYLECGPEVETLPKQLELLQQLGLNTAAFQEREQSTATGLKISQGTSNSLKISNLLKGILKNQRVLVILDDVWNVEFLQQMIDQWGSQVRCLVTSQRGDLCWRLNCSTTEISIQDIPRAVARKILASHVGFPDQEIPDGPIMVEAEKIIQETEGNPLALASVAAAIPRNRAYDLAEWKNVSKTFLRLIRTEDIALMQSKRYPKSFWSAMQFSIESLTEEAQKVLILMHLCEGPSIPEEIIQYLHQIIEIEGSVVSFQSLKNELESRELLKISSTTAGPSPYDMGYSWSTHSLQKRFMEEEKNMRDRKNLMVDSIIGLLDVTMGSKASTETEISTASSICEEAMVQLSFCALYFEKDFAKKAASIMGIPYDRFANLRRNAIEPVTRLLVQLENDSDSGTTAMKASARQVFLEYICNGIMHNDGIRSLLESQISIRPMLDALINITLVEKTTFMESQLGGWLEKLIDSISDDRNPQVQELAASTLGYLATGNLGSVSKILDCHGALEHISNLLSEDKDPALQTAATWVLYNLAVLDEKDSNRKIINFPGLLEKLINLLSKDSNSLLQEWALCTLSDSGVGDDQTLSKILDSHGALEHLTNLLSEDKDPVVQLTAVDTIFNLTRGGLDRRFNVVDTPAMLKKLISWLSTENSARVQEKAARILGSWAEEGLVGTTNGVGDHAEGMKMELGGDMKTKLESAGDLIEPLLRLLAEGISPKTQGAAAFALTLIFPTRGNETRLFSSFAYRNRGYANLFLGLNNESLADFEKAYEAGKKELLDLLALRCPRIVLRVRLGDYEGALDDAEKNLEVERKAVYLQESGVVKRLMNNLPAALADFNEGLEAGDDYELLKQRGYVRFLMHDDEGACSDAELAMKVKTYCVDRPTYTRSGLAVTSVEYLEYKLR